MKNPRSLKPFLSDRGLYKTFKLLEIDKLHIGRKFLPTNIIIYLAENVKGKDHH
jgi:hypothetical protein